MTSVPPAIGRASGCSAFSASAFSQVSGARICTAWIMMRRGRRRQSILRRRRAYTRHAMNAGEPQITEVIRDAIRQRLLPPGAPLVQSAIAEAFGVSRIPVREALQYLASEGLVTLGDDGARVTLLSTAEIYELWTLRSVIEASMA